MYWQNSYVDGGTFALSARIAIVSNATLFYYPKIMCNLLAAFFNPLHSGSELVPVVHSDLLQ